MIARSTALYHHRRQTLLPEECCNITTVRYDTSNHGSWPSVCTMLRDIGVTDLDDKLRSEMLGEAWADTNMLHGTNPAGLETCTFHRMAGEIDQRFTRQYPGNMIGGRGVQLLRMLYMNLWCIKTSTKRSNTTHLVLLLGRPGICRHGEFAFLEAEPHRSLDHKPIQLQASHRP